jgi:hypothetical protein
MNHVIFDIAAQPFSVAGAWSSLSHLAGGRAPDGKEGVYFVTHHGGGETPLLRLSTLELGGTEVTARVTATPSMLTWQSEHGWIECIYESPRVLRFRGRGLTLCLEHHKLLVCHGDGPGRMTLNMRPVLRRYQVACLAGRLQWEGAWTAKREIKPRVVVGPGEDADATWEAGLIEYGSTVPALDHAGFDLCRKRAAAAFDEWLVSIPPVRPEWGEARRFAAYVQWSAMAEPCGLVRRPAMFMSKHWMAKVWNWDNGFNAMSLAAAGRTGLAWDQFRLFLDHQDEFGCLPDTLTDLSFHFNFCKPPIHGWMMSRILEANVPDSNQLESLYRGLEGWTRWWLQHRRRSGYPLPFYLHGNDSGWDNSTLFDSAEPVVAPDLAAYLVLQCETLSALAERLGNDGAARDWRREAERILAALLKELWVDGRFVGRMADDPARLVRCDSLICELPILLGQRLPADIRRALAMRIRQFVTDWGPATEQPQSPEYAVDGYWRGPIWAPSTYIVVEGLRACGEETLARDIAERYCRLCAAQGFAENYDALAGRALRDTGYTWSASVFLLLAADLARMRGSAQAQLKPGRHHD